MFIKTGWYVLSQPKSSTANSVNVKIHSRPIEDKEIALQEKRFYQKTSNSRFKRNFYIAYVEV